MMNNAYLQLMLLSLTYPQRAGALILRIRFPPPVIAQIAALVIVLDALMIVLSQMLNSAGTEVPELSSGTLISLQLISFVVMILATYLVGRMFGGTGDLPGTIVLLCWLNLIGVTFQSALLLISVVLNLFPWLGAAGTLAADLITGFSFFLFFWVYVHFVTALHAFKSALKVLGGILLTLFLVAFSAALALILFVA